MQNKTMQSHAKQSKTIQSKAMQSNHNRLGSREYEGVGCTLQDIVNLMNKIGCPYYDVSGYCSLGCYPEYGLCHKLIRNECTVGSRCKCNHVEDTTVSQFHAYAGSASSSRSSNHANTTGSSTDTSSSWRARKTSANMPGGRETRSRSGTRYRDSNTSRRPTSRWRRRPTSSAHGADARKGRSLSRPRGSGSNCSRIPTSRSAPPQLMCAQLHTNRVPANKRD